LDVRCPDEAPDHPTFAIATAEIESRAAEFPAEKPAHPPDLSGLAHAIGRDYGDNEAAACGLSPIDRETGDYSIHAT
jgi:hypothetical protein